MLHDAPIPTEPGAASDVIRVGPCAQFEIEPDPAREGAAAPAEQAQTVHEALARWQGTQVWIERGWDDIDEWINDLSHRETLAYERGAAAAARGTLDATLLRAVFAADRRFIAATASSALCVWHCGALYQAFGDGVAFPLYWYPREPFWYFYRWPPDTTIDFRCGDVIEYQRRYNGLDF